MFYEIWEHYVNGSKKQRFVSLLYKADNQEQEQLLVNGELPRSHGISYLYMRKMLQEDFGEVMGLDALLSGDEKLIQEAKEVNED
jgi:hypothetical protein